MQHHLNRTDLLSLEEYAQQRDEFRSRVLEHKKSRRAQIGTHASLYFEDRLTIQYQVQEMLRIEKVFEAGGINEELAAYNPLIPDGKNWKATFMVEYPDADERRVALTKLIGIEDRVWVQCGAESKVYAIADEDLDRTTDEKTSAVHFLRFELPESFVDSLKSGESLSIGIDHENYAFSADPVTDDIRRSLVADLD